MNPGKLTLRHWVPWQELPVPHPRQRARQRYKETILRTVSHPLGALRRQVGSLPLPWRRRLLGLLPRPRPGVRSTPGEWLAQLASLPAARPVLALADGRLSPPSLPGGGGEWAVVDVSGYLTERNLDSLRAQLTRTAGSPRPIGYLLHLKQEQLPKGERLARFLSWPQLVVDHLDFPPRRAAMAFPLLSVVVVVYRHPDLTRLCLGALCRWTAWPNLEVLVVDNASPDGAGVAAGEVARGDDRIRVITNDANVGFARAANTGVRASRGPLIALLNHDVVVSPGWEVPLLLHLLNHPEVGLVGPSTNAAGNEARVRAGYKELSQFRQFAGAQASTPRPPIPMPELGFFCVALRRQVWEELGGLDEGYGLGYFEDADFCHRARLRGWRLACLRDSFVHHWQGAAFAAVPTADLEALWEANRRRYHARRRG